MFIYAFSFIHFCADVVRKATLSSLGMHLNFLLMCHSLEGFVTIKQNHVCVCLSVY